MPWKLTVRAAAKVERRRYDSLDLALEALEARAKELAEGAPRRTVNARIRSFEPVQQVTARLEVAGPERFIASVRGGIDVRGDGSTEAYVGHTRRQLLEPKRGETPYKSLRRALARSQTGAGKDA